MTSCTGKNANCIFRTCASLTHVKTKVLLSFGCSATEKRKLNIWEKAVNHCVWSPASPPFEWETWSQKTPWYCGYLPLIAHRPAAFPSVLCPGDGKLNITGMYNLRYTHKTHKGIFIARIINTIDELFFIVNINHFQLWLCKVRKKLLVLQPYLLPYCHAKLITRPSRGSIS